MCVRVCMITNACNLLMTFISHFSLPPPPPTTQLQNGFILRHPKDKKQTKKTCAYHSKFISHCKPRIVISVGMYEEYSNVFCSHSSLGQCWTICQKDISHSSNTLRSGPGKGKGLVRVGNYSSWTSRTISMLFSAFLYL